MTMIVSPRGSRATAPAARPAILTTIVRGVAWVRQRLRLRRDTAKLLALSDHLLADLGVRRDQIGLVARDTYRTERVPR
ncbi:DUF1127 domain-containing protein [Inquilinus sp. YAF38]|uniref:DUF1127 domain-containing protein n=1 Tax=Inquilinus sp. YAF38 TaxID=3233084 RepID=UPI003F8EC46D